MTQQTFTDNVVVQGSRDVTQLQVQGNTAQTQPLTTWQDSGANPVAKVAKDGRYQTGDMNLGTPDALVEANVSITLPSSRPQRGVQSLGRLTGALSSAVAWAVHELELLGTGGVSALQTALRAKVTHNNSGSSGAAELRAGDFQSINQTGSSGTPVGRAAAVRGTASNTPNTGGNAYLTKAVGIEATVTNDTNGTITDASVFEVVPPTNAGTIGTLYGLRVPALNPGGTISDYASAQFGDEVELKVLGTTPTRVPPGGFAKVYPKLVGGVPHLFAKDSAGLEYDLGGGGGSLSSCAVGTLAPWPAASAPSGWLLCAGQAVSRATYSDLYALIGTTYGVGDGSTTFNVPDLRGRTALGLDNMGGSSANRVVAAAADVLGGSGGEENHTLTTGEMPAHTHGLPYHTGTPTNGATAYQLDANLSASTTTASTGGGAAHNNMPPYIALNWIIKALADAQAPAAEVIDDRVAQLLQAGPGIALNYNDAGNALTITNTGTGQTPVICRASTNVAQTFAGSSVYTIVNFNTVDFDSHSAFTTGVSSRFTAPRAGYYRVSADIVINSTLVQVSPVIFKNGSQYVFGMGAVHSSYDGLQIETTVYLNQGDLIDLRVYNNNASGVPLYTNQLWYNHIDIHSIDNANAVLISGGASSGGSPYVAEGRLSLSSTQALPSSDITAATMLYFVPFRGNRLALYNGSSWDVYALAAPLSLALAGLAANTNYDIFAYYNAGNGTVNLTAVAWSNSSAGTSVRATTLATQDGVYVKSGTSTQRYLGTIRTTGVSGQCEDSGFHRYLWNYYNRVPRWSRKTSNVSHSYATAAWRFYNGDSTLFVDCIVGVAEDLAIPTLTGQLVSAAAGNAQSLGIGLDGVSTIVNAFFNTSTNLMYPSVTHPTFLTDGYHTFCITQFANGTGGTWQLGQMFLTVWG